MAPLSSFAPRRRHPARARADQVHAHSSAGDVFAALLSPATRLDAGSSAGDVRIARR